MKFNLSHASFRYLYFFKNKVLKVLGLFLLRLKYPYFPLSIIPSFEHYHLRKSVICPDFIVDVGFNRGQFSSLCLLLFRSARLYSFDPNPLSCRFAEKLSTVFKGRLHFFNIGLSSTHADMELLIANGSDNCSYYTPTELNTSTFARAKIISSIPSSVVRLDSLDIFNQDLFASKSGLLKIDAQGSELAVLQGALNVIHLFRYIYVEVTDLTMYEGQSTKQDIVDLLSSMSFQLKSCHNVDLRNGSICYADFLFEATRNA